MKVVDTTVAVDHLRGLDAATGVLAACLTSGEDLFASEVVRFELLVGARKSELAALEAFFTTLTWVPVGQDVARTAAQLARRYRASHSGIDDADYLVAATSLVLDAGLLTTNVAHFPMIDGLRSPY